MKQIFDSIIRDISSFVENEIDVIPDKKGHIIFEKGGTMYELEVLPKGDDDSIKVEYLGEVMSYRTFLSKHLAHLDQLASKILQKNKFKIVYFTNDLYKNLNNKFNYDNVSTEYEEKFMKKNKNINKIIWQY